MNEKTSKDVDRRRTNLLLLMTLFTLVLLLFSEVFLRWYYRDVLSTADGRSVFSARSEKRIKSELNRFHLRGKSFDPEPDDRYRIVAMGDSFTFGQGVSPATKRYTEKLEQMLHDQTPEIGILVANAGVCGRNLIHHNRNISFIDGIHPDFVLYQWYVNDMDTWPDLSKVKTPPLILNRKMHKFLWQHSALYYLLHQRYGQIRTAVGKQTRYADYLALRLQDPQQRHYREARRQLVQLIDSFKNRGIDFGMVLFPSFSGPLYDYKLDFLHDRVLEVCKTYQVNCLDLRDAFKKVYFKDLWANVFDAHPNELAHTLAAEAIFAHFGNYWEERAQKHRANIRPAPEPPASMGKTEDKR